MSRVSKYIKEIEDTETAKYKAALYIRLSVEDGDKEESNSVINQRMMLSEFVNESPDIELYDVYIDDGYTGTDFERPGFTRLLNDLYIKKFNTVIVKDLSRLGRNYIEVGNYIEKIFPLFNIRFISINDQIDSKKDPDSVNSLIVPFKNLINDEYCRDISNKIKAVQKMKMKKGEYIGSYAPYGYIKDPEDKHKLIIDEEAAKIIRLIFEWTLNGYSRTAIAKKLNELGILNPTGHRAEELNMKIPVASERRDKRYSWGITTIRQILMNQMYCGDVVQHKGKLISYKIHKRVVLPKSEWIVVEDTHEPIISREIFDKVQNEIINRDTRMNENGKISIFAGHIKCGDCLRAMSKKVAGKYKGQPRKHYHYMCSLYMRTAGAQCSKHSIRNDELESAVLQAVKVQIGLVADIRRIRAEIESNDLIDNRKKLIEKNIEKCEKQIKAKKKLRQEAYEDWKSEKISEVEYNEYTEEYSAKIKKIEENINNYYKDMLELDKTIKDDSWIDNFTKFQNVNELSRELIDNLIDNIYVYEEKKIKIKFKYEDEFEFLLNYIKNKKKIINEGEEI